MSSTLVDRSKKIRPEHLDRAAYIYVRQSSPPLEGRLSPGESDRTLLTGQSGKRPLLSPTRLARRTNAAMEEPGFGPSVSAPARAAWEGLCLSDSLRRTRVST
jgi:hypothetical protein